MRLPGGGPELAALFQVFTLLKLSLSEAAAHKRVAVLVNAIGEVLTGHADHTPFPALQFTLFKEVPLLHDLWM
ncbi:hypothetical protein KR52_11750 [Synechococcus sp. KORDI-52]|nr:hypothetical protein KR52_11750 [Synechococcus sp. KORDI-52]